MKRRNARLLPACRSKQMGNLKIRRQSTGRPAPEQAFQPSLGKVFVDTLMIDEAVNRISKETGIPRLYVQEVAERVVKPKLEAVRLWVDGGSK